MPLDYMKLAKQITDKYTVCIYGYYNNNKIFVKKQEVFEHCRLCDLSTLALEFTDQKISTVTMKKALYNLLGVTMPLSQTIEQARKTKRLVYFDDSTVIGSPYTGYVDTRTTMVHGVPHVMPIGETLFKYIIVCPHCGDLHFHGNRQGTGALGLRSSHCGSRAYGGNRGYVITDGTYSLKR